MAHEGVLRTLLEITDDLTDDFDVVEVLTFLSIRCVEILDVTTAAVMLAAPEGDLRCVASSSEAKEVVDLLELQARQGPTLADLVAADHVSAEDAYSLRNNWPNFGPEMVRAGYSSIHSFALRVQGTTIGSLTLHRRSEGKMSVDDLLAAQALSKFGTLIILQQRDFTGPRLLSQQIANAINERSLVDVAKTWVSAEESISLEDAFAQMRSFALRNRQSMSNVAQDIVEKARP
jgi:hypothetical protein